ncbi:MAG: histidinol-phosphate transaminase [Actinomycetota bacterium]|nr:histidinol-phosphate transaminase [Actinomycetota bacterium]
MTHPTIRSDLRTMEGYHSPQLDVEVRLNTNESPFPPPEEFVSAFMNEVRRVDWHRYPDRLAQSLREDIAAIHEVEPQQVFVANGSNEVLQTICLTFGGSGRTVATFEPTYAMYQQIARTTQCKVIEGARDSQYRVALSEVEKVVARDHPNIIFFCSPNNPTGTPERLEVIEGALKISDGVVVVDEAYGQFADFTALDLLRGDEAADSLIVTRTFSKTWSMAGARLGYCVAPSWMLPEFEKVVLPYHLDSVKQIAGRVALRFYGDMEERVAKLGAERDRITEALTLMGLDVWPSQANFIMFRTTPCSLGGDYVWQRLVDQSVLIRNCSNWPGLADCLRVTLGTENENNIFLEALKEALA